MGSVIAASKVIVTVDGIHFGQRRARPDSAEMKPDKTISQSSALSQRISTTASASAHCGYEVWAGARLSVLGLGWRSSTGAASACCATCANSWASRYRSDGDSPAPNAMWLPTVYARALMSNAERAAT